MVWYACTLTPHSLLDMAPLTWSHWSNDVRPNELRRKTVHLSWLSNQRRSRTLLMKRNLQLKMWLISTITSRRPVRKGDVCTTLSFSLTPTLLLSLWRTCSTSHFWSKTGGPVWWLAKTSSSTSTYVSGHVCYGIATLLIALSCWCAQYTPARLICYRHAASDVNEAGQSTKTAKKQFIMSLRICDWEVCHVIMWCVMWYIICCREPKSSLGLRVLPFHNDNSEHTPLMMTLNTYL